MDNSNTKYLTASIRIAIINLLSIFFLKYSQNGLSGSDFRFFKTGNLINTVISILLISGLLLLYSKRKNINLKPFKTLSLLYFFPLLVVIVIKILHIKLPEDYFLGYPYKKYIPVIFLLANQTLLLYLTVLTLVTYIGGKKNQYISGSIYTVGVILLLMMTSFAATFDYTEGTIDKNHPYDLGIILGAAVWSGNKPSPIFKGRIDKGLELYKKGVIKKIQLTGSNAPGEISEARAAINYLHKKNIPDKGNILIEENTTTTIEQIKYVKEHFTQKKTKRIVFISDKFHLKRILEMADFFNIKAEGISSDYKLTRKKSLFYRLRDSVGLLLFWIFAI